MDEREKMYYWNVLVDICVESEARVDVGVGVVGCSRCCGYLVLIWWRGGGGGGPQ